MTIEEILDALKKRIAKLLHDNESLRQALSDSQLRCYKLEEDNRELQKQIHRFREFGETNHSSMI